MHPKNLIVPLLILVPVLAPADRRAPSDAFGHLVFEDRFSVDSEAGPPTGWTVLKSQMHEQCRVEDGAYRILFGMNTHCPAPVELKDFAIEFDVRGYRETPVACLFFDFRVQPDRRADRAGYRVLYRWGKPDFFKERFAGNEKLEPLVEALVPKTARFDLVDLRHRANIDPILSGHRMEFGSPGSFDPTIVRGTASEMTDIDNVGEWTRIRIEVAGNAVRLFHDGHYQGELRDPKSLYPHAGMLGFDIWGSSRGWEGGLWFDNVKVYAREPLPTAPVFHRRNIHIPEKYNRIHGGKMLYDVRVSRYGRAWKLWGKVRGGGCRAGVSHITETPYVRLDSVDGRHSVRLPLFRGTLGAGLGRRGPQCGPYGPADHSGPVENECFIDFDPAGARVAVGYDYYTIPPRYQDGSCEVTVDSRTGDVLCEGPPMRDGAKLTMASPPEKPIILDRVDGDNPFRDGFREFLKDNHFFVEGEVLRFRSDLLLRQSDSRRSYACRHRVLDAYGDPRSDGVARWALTMAEGQQAETQRGAGLRPFTSGWQSLQPLPVGVYHLHLEARDDRGAKLAELTKAFSVLPATVDLAETPAERAGLPTFFGGNPYPFHATYQADAAHYASWTGEWAHRPAAMEIKHALNQRVLLNGAKLNTAEGVAVAREYRPYYQALSRASLPPEYSYLNSPRIYNKASRCVKEFVTGFLESEFFRPDPKRPLNVTGDQVEALDRSASNRPISRSLAMRVEPKTTLPSPKDLSHPRIWSD